MHRRLPEQRAIGCVSRPLNECRSGPDLASIRLAFARLFDEATELALRQGLDADEIILKRRLVVRTQDGAEREILVDFLSDEDRFHTQLLAGVAKEVGNVGLEDLTIRTAIVEVLSECMSSG